MLELQTFGTVGLRSRDEGDSVAELVQPKRLALMVYLGLTPRRRFRRRDHLLALLWPELDTEHARGALNQALRYLRRSLGDDVVLTQGDDEIATNRERVWCDATEFRTRCEAAEWASALALYQGPFLHGFFADASPEFDEWVAGERSELQLRAVQAAMGLSEAAEARSDLAAAVHWARRATLIAPDDEPCAARQIRLMDLNGDRVGALKAYESLRRRMHQEFGTRPSAGTEAIVARIRAG